MPKGSAKNLRVTRMAVVPAAVVPAAVVLAAVTLSGPRAAAQEQTRPTLETNEAYVEDVTRGFTLDVKDPMAVFGFVFASLPQQVKVYPTENYYYFKFHYHGAQWAGNIRIEPQDAGRDGEGGVVVHFVYYQDGSQWYDEESLTHIVLNAARGVTVEHTAPLVYRLSFGGRSVVFALNDLSQVRPPAGTLAPGETFIGPIFDESAIRFFLVFNARLKLFHYVLDETVPVADEFFSAPQHPRIVVGKRTGFAFYRDRRRERKILIGVFADNYRFNSWFDGPFDQLPDNFIVGDTLRRAILKVEPGLKGEIDRFGSAPGGEVRYEIRPYATYRSLGELGRVDDCARSRLNAASYYACFVAASEERAPAAARQRAHQRRRHSEGADLRSPGEPGT